MSKLGVTIGDFGGFRCGLYCAAACVCCVGMKKGHRTRELGSFKMKLLVVGSMVSRRKSPYGYFVHDCCCTTTWFIWSNGWFWACLVVVGVKDRKGV